MEGSEIGVESFSPSMYSLGKDVSDDRVWELETLLDFIGLWLVAGLFLTGSISLGLETLEDVAMPPLVGFSALHCLYEIETA